MTTGNEPSTITWEEGTMEPRHSTVQSTISRLVLAPLVATAVVGGAAVMLGLPKRERSGRSPKTAARNWSDPRVQKAVETAQRALDDAREQLATHDADTLQQEFKRRTGSVADATRANVAPAMKDAGDRARDLAERMRSDVAPRARTFAQEAIDEAEEILGEARKRATLMSNEARKNYGPDVSQGASALVGLVAAGSSAGMQILRDRSREMSKRNSKQRARSGIDKGKKKTSAAMHSAGGRVKSTMSESLGIMFWAAACSAVVYFVLLGEEKRERVKQFFSGAASQIQDVMSDFRDVGEEFDRNA